LPRAARALPVAMHATFLVDMDKVPPLAARSGSSAPPTARSGSSNSATPRTGGGTTARSSDGKGTPRDCERLPLGARPRNERSGGHGASDVPRLGLAGQPPQTPPVPSSPLTTWRSGAASSPASSQGALSSRSRADSLSQDIFPTVHHGPMVQGPYSARGLRNHNDLSREIDAVRRTIQQENRLLQINLTQISEEAGRVRTACANAAAASAAATAAPAGTGSAAAEPPPFALRGYCPSAASSLPAPRRSRVLEWRIAGVDGRQGAEHGLCSESSFELPEYPEVVFALRFGAGRSAASGCSGAAPGCWPCQLRLRVSGSGCANIELCIGLSAELVESEGADLDGMLPSGAGALLGRAEGVLLSGGGRVACPCAWPQVAGAAVLCSLRVEFAGVQPGRLRCARSARPAAVLGEADLTGGFSPTGSP